ncbi:hypothetical protein BDF20DRAFT_916922 [Mycotypha africana]|uniref:uncharacterized protein n=1 Tax=Mycotypha africana TaxID=64632 RepID=UPI00230117D5|nr:uncharacterized protein BDF20DRAFT_916922 [Mycotypha africana]KAI8968386.1 hypothetical protein BDF20DRAFT_916922 [Mycotypha africana]
MNTDRQHQQMQQQHPNHHLHNQGPVTKDIEQIRTNYRLALKELTFNSKPIITNLTIMAQEHQMAAGVIVGEIENQLRNNAPAQKLPVLYLIDSICKNIGGVYIVYFGRNMVNLFLDAYTLADPTVRRSFERLLQTWKNGMPGGQPVFSRNVIESIERSIIYIREKTPISRYPHHPSHPNTTTKNKYSSPHVTNSSIHVNPNFIKDQHHRLGANTSRDPRMKSSLAAPHAASAGDNASLQLLSQLQSMLPSSQQTINSPLSNATPQANILIPQLINQIKAILPTLPPAQATSIEQVLSQIVAASPVPPTSTLPAVTTVSTASPSLATAPNGLPQSYATPVSTNAPTPIISNIQNAPLNTILSTLSNVTPINTASPVITSTSNLPQQTQQPTAAPQVDTAGLLKSLTSLGYLTPTPPPQLPVPSASVTPSSTSTPPPPPPTATTETVDLSLDAMGPFILESKDLQRLRPGAIELLYSAEPLQCKQCGLRYPETEKGQAKMDAHLDAHFRQNRKMKERVKRGLSRSWFVSVDEWVRGEGGELTSQQAPTFLHDSQVKKMQKSNGQSNSLEEDEAIDPNAYTVVMPDDTERKPCPICGERFIDFWNDDEEEWMFKNAILVNDKIYHATCHADAVKSGSFEDTNTSEQIQNANGLKRKSNEEGDEEQSAQKRRLE